MTFTGTKTATAAMMRENFVRSLIVGRLESAYNDREYHWKLKEEANAEGATPAAMALHSAAFDKANTRFLILRDIAKDLDLLTDEERAKFCDRAASLANKAVLAAFAKGQGKE